MLNWWLPGCIVLSSFAIIPLRKRGLVVKLNLRSCCRVAVSLRDAVGWPVVCDNEISWSNSTF